MRQHEQALLLLKKAEEDIALLSEIIDSDKISNEIFGFHSQQAAEKCLKAMLSEFGVSFTRTHNLRLLMDLLADAGHPLPASLADLDFLTPYGTLFRYEAIPENVGIDRKAVYKMIGMLHSITEKNLEIPENK
jgi:HEPN domain-containing protein